MWLVSLSNTASRPKLPVWQLDFAIANSFPLPLSASNTTYSISPAPWLAGNLGCGCKFCIHGVVELKAELTALLCSYHSVNTVFNIQLGFPGRRVAVFRRQHETKQKVDGQAATHFSIN